MNYQMMMNPRNTFRGYRSHPVYLERVSNFMADIQAKTADANNESEQPPIDEVDIGMGAGGYNPSFQAPLYQQQTSFRTDNNASLGPSVAHSQAVSVAQSQSTSPTASRQSKRSVKSSDLRSKRKNLQSGVALQQATQQVQQSAVMSQAASHVQQALGQEQPAVPALMLQNNQQQYGGMGGNNMYGYMRKSQPSHSVKLALESGAFQADSY